MMRKVFSIIIFVFILNVVSTAYAKEVKVVISVDKNRVEIGSHIRLTVGVEGAFDTNIPELAIQEIIYFMLGLCVSNKKKSIKKDVKVLFGSNYVKS